MQSYNLLWAFLSIISERFLINVSAHSVLKFWHCFSVLGWNQLAFRYKRVHAKCSIVASQESEGPQNYSPIIYKSYWFLPESELISSSMKSAWAWNNSFVSRFFFSKSASCTFANIRGHILKHEQDVELTMHRKSEMDYKLKCLSSSTNQRIVLVLADGDLCKRKRLG